jgi:hypothetical protein
MVCKPVRDETKRFFQERDSLANDVALRNDILDVGREGPSGSWRMKAGGESR